VRRAARQNPTHLVIGLDANADGLREVSRRSKARPANMLFGRLAIEDAPGELAGLADCVTVLLPWGSLLRAVALPDLDALRRLGALCRPGAHIRIVFGYDPAADNGTIAAFGLPRLDDPEVAPALARHYLEAGFAVTVRSVSRYEVRALPTTWAKKLAFSGHDRSFIELTGRRDR
jgi:hypothetical protein